ncbi:MAG TPA: alpha/beta hydrolase [Thermoanaerobaculia bacterium]|nr:alpha/beta hydrolase [Thermoanaerobaculia bacterium]
MSRTQLVNLVRILRAGGPRDPRAPLAEVRASFEKLGRLLAPPSTVGAERAAVGGVPCEVSIPARESAEGVLVYLHGGGYVSGSPATHRGLAGRLAQACGVRVVTVGYRLAPEHPFPAALEDCLAVVEELHARDPAQPLVLAGDSAGGGLVVAALVELRDRSRLAPVVGGVCLSPWTDLEITGESVRTNAAGDPLVGLAGLRRMAALYLDGTDPRAVLASPIHARLDGLPPLLVLVGSTEALLDDSRRLVAALQRAGVEATLEVWEDMIHVWPLYAPLLDEGQQAIERVACFARQALGRSGGLAAAPLATSLGELAMRAGGAGEGLAVGADHVGTAARAAQALSGQQHAHRHREHDQADADDGDQDEDQDNLR